MCVAPPTHVGAWSMAVLLGQPFEYYYYSFYNNIYALLILVYCNSISTSFLQISINHHLRSTEIVKKTSLKSPLHYIYIYIYIYIYTAICPPVVDAHVHYMQVYGSIRAYAITLRRTQI